MLNLALISFTHALGKHLDSLGQANHALYPCACALERMCVFVTVRFIQPLFSYPRLSISFIETLPRTTSSPVLIVAATNHDKYLRLDNEYLLWLINYHNPEHDRTTCKYDVIFTLMDS